MYPQGWEPPPAKIAPIHRPGTSRLARALSGSADLSGWNRESLTLVGPVLVPFGFLLLVAVPGFGAFGAVAALVSTIVLLLVAVGGMVVGRRDVIAGPDYRLDGVPIEGAALDLLADIQHRFAWAERKFGEVPTGIRWAEVEHDVEVLIWEAAGHAAKVSALDAEIRDLGYADPGTPLAALRDDLQVRRRSYWTMLEETQREADDLAREATNTAAAARLALRTGTLADLELLTPSGAELAARGTLAAARARLQLLAEVWSELDEGHPRELPG
jgi:hypothetical protein